MEQCTWDMMSTRGIPRGIVSYGCLAVACHQPSEIQSWELFSSRHPHKEETIPKTKPLASLGIVDPGRARPGRAKNAKEARCWGRL